MNTSPLISEHSVGILLLIRFGFFTLAAVGTTAYFRMYPNVSVNRIVYRALTIAYGTGFLVLVVANQGLSRPMLMWSAGVVLIIYLNIRFTYFCEACGKPYTWLTLTLRDFCRRCGHAYPLSN